MKFGKIIKLDCIHDNAQISVAENGKPIILTRKRKKWDCLGWHLIDIVDGKHYVKIREQYCRGGGATTTAQTLYKALIELCCNDAAEELAVACSRRGEQLMTGNSHE